MLLYEHYLMKLSYVDKLFDPQNGLWTTYTCNETIEFMVPGPKHIYAQE